jgi:2-oxoisovalerate dehydrogenase E2 component (dihydrolipoyl transacylase)
MPLFTFRLPDIGEGISEAEIVGWHVKVGDRVEEDQPIADMMTDKATVEMESPVAGVVKRLAGEAGEQVAIGAMLVEIEVDGESENAPPSQAVIEAETPGTGEVEAAPLNGIMSSSVRPEAVEGPSEEEEGGIDKLGPTGNGDGNGPDGSGSGARVLASCAGEGFGDRSAPGESERRSYPAFRSGRFPALWCGAGLPAREPTRAAGG